MPFFKKGLHILGGVCLGLITACHGGGGKMKMTDYFSGQMVELMQTIQQGEESRARHLLAGGLSLNVHGEEGITPLFYFLANKDKPAMRLALKLGADPNMKASDGAAPLVLSLRSDDDEFAAILLAAGADPNTLNRDGDPVLFDAISYEHMGQIKLLIHHGADVNLKNRAGENSVLHCAYINKFEIVYRLITEYGADYKVLDQSNTDIAWLINDALTDNLINPKLPVYGWVLKVKQYLIDHGIEFPPNRPLPQKQAY